MREKSEIEEKLYHFRKIIYQNNRSCEEINKINEMVDLLNWVLDNNKETEISFLKNKNEMNYQKERTCFILDKGIYKGFKYSIVSYGTHPCCYVFIPENHKYYGVNYDDIDIECHGGLTYSNYDLCFNPVKNDEWVIGWDYAHWGDYMGYYEIIKSVNHEQDKKWTIQELYDDVKSVIEQLQEEKE